MCVTGMLKLLADQCRVKCNCAGSDGVNAVLLLFSVILLMLTI